jgi:ribonuclease G
MKTIFIERREKLLRIAIRDNGELKECFIEEDHGSVYPGQVYKGVVKNIVPAIKCAFIDIGLDKNAYLYLDSKFKNNNIKKGQELIVEVVKEEIGGKGAKVTTAFSVPGRYSVLTTLKKDLSFSGKIDDDNFKRNLSSEVIKPKEIGIIIRTNAVGIPFDDINSEIERLYGIYSTIVENSRYKATPGLLYSDEGIIDKVLRDNIDENTKEIIVDSPEDYDRIRDYVDNKRDITARPKLYDEHRTLFDYYGIEKEILGLRGNRVNLPCGGYIIIDKTEAMYVIDVNSGKNVNQSEIQKTAEITNIQAAEKIASQIRLRNLSGIIVVDFIDLESEDVKNKILSVLKKGFEGDKNKTVIYPFSELNLVQIARRRRGKNIYDFMEEDCKACKGHGKKLKASYIYNLIKNDILKIDSGDNIKSIYIEVNELYKTTIKENILEFVKSIGGLDKSVYLNFNTTVEYYKVEPLIFMKQIQNVEKYKIYG